MPLNLQSKVILANIMANLEIFPTKLLHDMISFLPQRKSHSSCLKTQVAAALAGVSQSSLDRVKKFDFPAPARKSSETKLAKGLGEDAASSSDAKGLGVSITQEAAMMNLVDIALSNASEGRTFIAFERDAERNMRRGVSLENLPKSRG